LANVPDQSRPDLVSIDFFTLLTVRLRVLFVFVVLAHDRRRVLHFNITEHPSAAWLAQQIVDAFPDDSAPSYLLRDRDQVDGQQFRHQVKSVRIARSPDGAAQPWQNPFAEWLIGSIRRECLDHVLVLGERHLRQVTPRRTSSICVGRVYVADRMSRLLTPVLVNFPISHAERSGTPFAPTGTGLPCRGGLTSRDGGTP
jgi:hypothetical protein